MFRGQRLAEWSIQSSLERVALNRFQAAPNAMPEIETALLRAFKRQVHHYIGHPPQEHAEWLALMQHHGAPTRLVDWTYSFYIAAFFAIESVFPGETCAIWAYDYRFWTERARTRLSPAAIELLAQDRNSKNPKTKEAILASPPLVYAFNPFRKNQRLAVQQGVFLVGTDVTKSFMDNMRAMIVAPGDARHFCKIEVACSLPLLREALKDLHRMNINHTLLFPGLDGFARSLNVLPVNPDFLPTDGPLAGISDVGVPN
jgi:hypothetical protein